MVRWVVGSIRHGGPIELFLVPSNYIVFLLGLLLVSLNCTCLEPVCFISYCDVMIMCCSFIYFSGSTRTTLFTRRTQPSSTSPSSKLLALFSVGL